MHGPNRVANHGRGSTEPGEAVGHPRQSNGSGSDPGTVTTEREAPEGAWPAHRDRPGGRLTDTESGDGTHRGVLTVDSEGARLFLDQDAAQLLDDKALDASVDSAGSVQFELAEQM